LDVLALSYEEDNAHCSSRFAEIKHDATKDLGMIRQGEKFDKSSG
jgi:hypothetical protein